MKSTDLKLAATSFSQPHGGLSELNGLPRDAEGPVFKEPWEAQAFAMTLALHERGVFTWSEWAGVLTQAIRDAQAAGDPDTGENYYRHWLVALERITTDKGLVRGTMLAVRKQEWVDAAHRTPHGQPIAL